MRVRSGLLLSELLFLAFILGSLLAVFWFNRPEDGTPRRHPRAERGQMVAYLARPHDDHGARQAVGGSLPRSGTRIGGSSAEEGMIVARDALDPAILAGRTSPGISAAAATDAPRDLSGSRPAAAEEGRSVFVVSRRGLPIQSRGQDVWSGWQDQNHLNIGGTEGQAALQSAFKLAAGSRAAGIVGDLVRKGIEIAFGSAEDFSGEHAEEIATFDFSQETAPGAGAPETLPRIRFNPLFLHEDPAVLASALVHEATHFQQFLDGRLCGASPDQVDLEFAAWSNEAAFWDEIRSQRGPAKTFLELQEEFAYRTTLRGEAALRDLLEALHG